MQNPVPAQMPMQTGIAQFDPSKLADIHLPENISFWPIANGWWLLLALVILIIFFIIWFKKAKSKKPLHKEKTLKSQALDELSAINEDYKTHNEAQEAVKQLSIFLRRYALSLFQRNNIASLTDEQWLSFLDEMYNKIIEKPSEPRPENLFSQKFNELLTSVPYQPAKKTVDAELLTQLFETTHTLVEAHSLLSSQEQLPLEKSSQELRHV